MEKQQFMDTKDMTDLELSQLTADSYKQLTQIMRQTAIIQQNIAACEGEKKLRDETKDKGAEVIEAEVEKVEVVDGQ